MPTYKITIRCNRGKNQHNKTEEPDNSVIKDFKINICYTRKSDNIENIVRNLEKKGIKKNSGQIGRPVMHLAPRPDWKYK